jgi:hypothetical protein
VPALFLKGGVGGEIEGGRGACGPPALSSKDFRKNLNLELISLSIVSSLLEISSFRR